MAHALSTKKPTLPPFTFSASMSRLLRPISRGMKRCGLLKVAPRVQGKILETEAGTRFILIEQKGKDVWRGRFKTLEEAIENDAAGIGVDRVLLSRCGQHNISTVMVVIEEQRRLFLAPVEQLMDAEQTKSRTSYNGRALRVLDYSKWTSKYLGPALTGKRKRASAL